TDSDIGSVQHLITGSDAQPALTHASVNTESDLASRLTQAGRDSGYPVVIAVNTQREPFSHDYRGELSGGPEPYRIVTVTGFDPSTGRVSIAEHRGSAHDHIGDNAIPLHDLYMATRPPGSPEVIADLRQRQNTGSQAERADTQMNLLRERLNAHEIDY